MFNWASMLHFCFFHFQIFSLHCGLSVLPFLITRCLRNTTNLALSNYTDKRCGSFFWTGYVIFKFGTTLMFIKMLLWIWCPKNALREYLHLAQIVTWGQWMNWFDLGGQTSIVNVIVHSLYLRNALKECHYVWHICPLGLISSVKSQLKQLQMKHIIYAAVITTQKTFNIKHVVVGNSVITKNSSIDISAKFRISG